MKKRQEKDIYHDMLKLDNREWCADPRRLKEFVGADYSEFFTKDNNLYHRYNIKEQFSKVHQGDMMYLINIVFDDEICQVVFVMPLLKVLGLEGLPILFYQKNLSIVGNLVRTFVRQLMSRDLDIAKFNSATLILIPKVANAKMVK
ncbi:hypothetical protein J1N35_038209 [Gossypium stocksii]|uniref:Uncharacterized protein n=1 Tax=Gossypium stocksii TaxID=47602 RepID=A0A9D3ULF9_9ROSI|nr:hypothetical protein J1N35_038209 [Gossypium stocksii]